jgi:hypothetical protein
MAPRPQFSIKAGHGTDHILIKIENKIFLIYKEIQSGAVEKPCMKKGFLILYEEMRNYFPIYCMRRPLVICDFATAPF